MDVGALSDVFSEPAPALDAVVIAVASIGSDFVSADSVLITLEAFATDAPTDHDGLLEHVFGTLGFRGNVERYYDHSNSLIHRVLERRLGNPLSLAVVATEIGRRAGVFLQPVGMPGHVLLTDETNSRWFDPFAGGRGMDLDACATRFERLFPDTAFNPELLEPMTPLAVASRMLLNLRTSALRAGDASFLADVLSYRLQLPNAGVSDRIDLANVLAALGRHEQSAEQHEILAALRPDAAEKHERAAFRQRAHNN